MRVRTLLLSGLIGLCFGAPAGAAQTHGRLAEGAWVASRGEARPVEIQQRMISVREAVEMVRSRYGGDLISARLEQNGDRPYYVLRWRLPNDQVQDIRVDAVTGAISR